jgi:hypothetical protein
MTLDSTQPAHRADSIRITRREMITRVGAAAALVGAPGLAAAGGVPKARVVVVTAREAMGRENTPLALIEQMVEKGITTLAGKRDPTAAWTTFIRKTDHMCMAVASGQLENVPEVDVAVLKALTSIGIDKITVGTARPSKAWRDALTTNLRDRQPELITDKLFGIANLPMDSLLVTPTIKHHEIAGISGTLKLYAAFSKRGPWNYHGNEPIHAASWDGKIGGGMGACGWVPPNDFGQARKLHILDMIRVGTTSRFWTAYPEGWVYTKSIVLSTDPVAADRVAFDMYLKVGQAAGRIDPLYHVERADTEYHAGISDLSRIDIQRVMV